MMLVALLEMPYGYYQLLRLVTAVAGAWIAYSAWQADRIGWAIAIGIVALLFNPVVPVHFERETWAILNVIAAAILGLAGWALTREPKASER
ncbi:hypothetical protein LRS08_18670 [Sphingomonas sp. J315]|nr:hypothetical protein [Sphingomonas sp. J344]UUX99437.1 hypothetical protein LRS08_18670 [Sphingomonas sp. J315]